MLKNLILKESYKKILCLFIVSLIIDIFISGFLANILYLYTLFTIFVFRNTSIEIKNIKSILSPINGEISAIDYKNNKTIIYIDVCIFSQHTFTSPINANLTSLVKRSGINLDTNTYLAKNLNTKITFDIGDLNIILLEDNCSMGTYIDLSKSSFKQGEKIAIFTSGKVIITLGKKINTSLKIGQKVYSTKTIIA
ncbi:MAG: hypothetical protein HRT40_06940 [Campylobacteraceae bacterium]|nr:hypothetical protein [Campylobacteraceae bacterium]